MADTNISIQDFARRAEIGGKETRNQTKKSLRAFRLIGLTIAAIFAIVAIGYDIFTGGETKNTEERRTMSPTLLQPPRFTDGMILDLRPGQSELIVLAGRIKVVNYDLGHCLAFTPDSVAKRKYNKDQTEAWVTPTSTAENLVMISKLRPGESMNGKRCPTQSN